MLKKIVAAAIATLALGLVAAANASAEDGAVAALMDSRGGEVGDFEFDPVGEKVSLYDAQPDGWGMLLELWWGGRLQRWCYNTKGASSFQKCDFEIPEGRDIRFYIAQISWHWFDCKRQGCGKRPHFWAGPFSNGCDVVGRRQPCGYGGHSGTAPETLDFLGEA